jgi:protein CpxP
MNNNNNRWLTILTLLLVTANIVTLTLLWTSHGKRDREDRGMPPPQGQVFEFLNNELKLDSSQREAYRKLREEHQQSQQVIQDSTRKQKDAFFALLQQPAVADGEVEAAAKKITDTQQKLELLTFRHFQKLRALCNTEQQKKFDSIIKDVLKRMAPQRNRMGPPPSGMEKEGPGRFPPPPPGEGPVNEPPKEKERQ